MPNFTERVRLFETSKIPYVIEEGRKATEQHLAYLRNLLTNS